MKYYKLKTVSLTALKTEYKIEPKVYKYTDIVRIFQNKWRMNYVETNATFKRILAKNFIEVEPPTPLHKVLYK